MIQHGTVFIDQIGIASVDPRRIGIFQKIRIQSRVNQGCVLRDHLIELLAHGLSIVRQIALHGFMHNPTYV